MKQPYIYTLPEQFLHDQSVPARWRVWAVINGFFVSGKTCWASNEWLGVQIKSHKDTVSQAVSELEDLGLMTCKRTARTRLISPADPMIGTDAYLRSVSTPISDRHQRLSTSDSNSDNIPSVAEAPRVVIISEREEREKIPARFPHSKEVFGWFIHPQPSWLSNKTERAHAEMLWNRGEKDVRGILLFLEKNKGHEFCPQVTSPTDLERKWPAILAFAKKNNL